MLKLIGIGVVIFIIAGVLISAAKEGGIGTFLAIGIGLFILFIVGTLIHPAAAFLLFAVVLVLAGK